MQKLFIAGAAALFISLSSLAFAQAPMWGGGYGMGPGMMGWGGGYGMGPGMMGGYGYGMGPGMMGGYGMGPGMMGGYGYGMGPGMRGGYGMGPGTMGRGWGGGYGMTGPGWGNRQGYGYNEECQKYLDESSAMRKELNNKRFEYFEAMRNPKTKPEEVNKLEKEIWDLQQKIYAKAPAACR
jgi:hypothetical protein